MKSVIYILLISLIFFIACSKSNSDPMLMLFDVDDNLLDDLYELDSSGISFKPPLNWKPWSQEILAEFNKVSKDPLLKDSGTDIILTAVFSDSLDTNFCLLYEVDFNENELNEYLNNIISVNGDDDLQVNDFISNGLKFKQVFILKEKTINIKLIMEENDGYNFIWDYLIIRSQYNEISKMIESSIGSIKHTE